MMLHEYPAFYEKNHEFLNNPRVNLTFEQILDMPESIFDKWVQFMRKEVVRLWDEKGLPPRVGYNRDEIETQFKRMQSFPVHEFEMIDATTGENTIIQNTNTLGNAANQWYPTMMKTRINYSAKDDGRSIYDFFKRDDLFKRYLPYAKRHFRRDSFYHYSQCVPVGETLRHRKDVAPKTAIEWIKAFEAYERQYKEQDYWLSVKKAERAGYTGYTDKLRDQKFYELTPEELLEVIDIIPTRAKVDLARFKSLDGHVLQLRLFDLGQRLFPSAYKSFRVSMCQYAVNFPPLTAKYLYERFTEHCKHEGRLTIWDPSAGWGGRILGAMSVKDDRKIHYIGCDPNPDHTIELPDGTTSTKYAHLAEYYNWTTTRDSLWDADPHTYQIFQCGSEVIQHEPDFQTFKGKLDLVFTSPPYFNREAYSEDPRQSYKSFSTYDSWREGFLRETLKTAYEWLKPNRYLLWNIADIKQGKTYLPLEQDSTKIAQELGFEYKYTLKMLLRQMPGANRVNDDGTATAKNTVRVRGVTGVQKFEPVLVFYKPHAS